MTERKITILQINDLHGYIVPDRKLLLFNKINHLHGFLKSKFSPKNEEMANFKLS